MSLGIGRYLGEKIEQEQEGEQEENPWLKTKIFNFSKLCGWLENYVAGVSL